MRLSLIHFTMKTANVKSSILSALAKIAFDIALIYVCFFVCRVIFLCANLSYYEGKIFTGNFLSLIKGSLVFDTSGIIYLNLLFVALALLPFHLKEQSRGYGMALKGTYLTFNALGIIANLCDVVYFRYTGRRTTGTVFSEFSNEDNMASVFITEAMHSWYLIIAGLAMIFLLFKLYKSPLSAKPESTKSGLLKYYLGEVVALAFAILICAAGMRGGIDRSTRPITISNANQYIDSPVEAPLILNTPFSILRTWNKKAFVDPKYFSAEELNSIFTPVHQPSDSVCANANGKGKNVVVFIVESFGREYIGKYNPSLDGGSYKGYTPFIDSLLDHCLWFPNSFVNGRKSIDGMPSVLSGIPYFIEPFFLTPAALNALDGIAVELKSEGYHTAFFHGAKNGSMGFEAFARATGFDEYYGRTEFEQIPDFGGEKEFDNFWAIWDEPFLQYYCHEMNQMKEPFMTAVFTASSHHPYVVPEKYKDVYTEEGLAIHKCIRYTDNALRKFFEHAKKQTWFDNTLFVICSDHTNLSDHAEYQTDLGLFGGPVIFYAPGDSTMVGCRNSIAQQIDVMPTVLSYLGYDKPYISFGIDLLSTPENETFAVSYYNGTYQIVKNGYFLQFDGTATKAIFSLEDKLLEDNLVGTVDCQQDMETELKAIIQQYMSRMVEDRLKIK